MGEQPASEPLGQQGVRLMPGGAVVILAIVAALLGAPSPAFAAGNELSAPAVSPGSGTIETAFTFAVRYDGQFPATAVSVEVAGLALGMGLTSGSTSAGTWQVSALLPAGTWPTIFSASAEQGNASTLAGPTVSVGGGAEPASPPTPSPTAPPGNGTPGGGEPRTNKPDETQKEKEPAASKAPAPAPVASTAPAPVASTAPPPTAAPAPASGSGTPTPAPSPSAESGDGAGPTPEAASGGGPAGGGPGNAVIVGAGPVAGEPGGEVIHEAIEDGLIMTILIAGLAGIAGVALVGTAVLLAGRRRRDDEEEEEPTTATEAAGEATAILERRAMRRARARMKDDPILTALGIGEEPSRTRPRRRARQVSLGPGERVPPS